ncbi:hypothetical protein MGN70_001802 [Eutypa lata]|uniref:Uncharacterized protein n=1 Tax=Eutypa lata (strain UCR-EL1) TaxID=1287681 RepID=M7TC04_EUTLA|nr:hypothetical protein UCREL1_8833 [Eutypa lata UCREL1]KAI1256677.1 hypothetical protein MGN70_001802 [Eutypa lata]
MQFTFATVLALAATSTALGPRSNDDILSARDDGEIVCQDTDHVYGGSERENFVEGQKYLRKKGPVCDTEAGKCARVSCSNDGAVFLCSQDDTEHYGVDCGLIADYIDHIFDQCQQNTQYFYQLASGTQDNTEGWRVEVGYNSC